MGTLFFCKKSTWKDFRSNLPAVPLPPARRTALPQANSSRQPLFVSQFPRCISFSHSENPLKWEECLISRIDRSRAISFTSGAVRSGVAMCAMPQRNLGGAMANTTDKPWLMSEAAQSCTGRTDSPYHTLVCRSTDVFSRRPLYLGFRTCRIWRYLRRLLQKVFSEEGTYWFWTLSSRLLITRVCTVTHESSTRSWNYSLWCCSVVSVRVDFGTWVQSVDKFALLLFLKPGNGFKC